MIDRIRLSESELTTLAPGAGLPGRCVALLQQQKQTWELLRNGYNGLAAVQTRTIQFDGFTVNVQFNAARLASASAKVDEKSIKERKCFLCPANLPPLQRGLFFQNEYLILCNPFPILPEHFTISHIEHTPQRILPSFDALLALSRDMGEGYTAFYNGPQCGASAPDHLHLQAGNRGFMPIDDDYEAIKPAGQPLLENDRLRVYAVENYLRRLIAFESRDEQLLKTAFGVFHAAFQQLAVNEVEPLMNVLSLYEKGSWRVIVFPRARHRPSCFHAEGDSRILVSPGCVDLGGVVITPLEADFHKLNRRIVTQIFEEVCLPGDSFAQLCERLRENLPDTPAA